jgi:DNA helicase-2/ATP-dependent DNA helicase PcrA
MKNLKVVGENIDELSVDDIIKMSTPNPLCAPAINRYKIVKILYDIFGYDLEKDLLLALLDESEKQLILAPAGGAKTSTVNAKIVIQKLCRKSRLREGKIKGNNILSLVYGNSNVKDIQERHSELIYKLKRSMIKGIDNLDDNLQVYTMHAFCGMWIREYSFQCDMNGFKLMDDDSKNSLMTSAVNSVIEDYEGKVKLEEVNINTLLGLYNYMRERMTGFDSIDGTDKFIDLRLDKDFIEECFGVYDRVKRRKKRYDHTDSLTVFNQLITGGFDTKIKNTNGEEVYTTPRLSEEVILRINNLYEYVTADEVQDLTPIMRETLRVLFENSPVTFIGDDDQSIFAFRGADSDIMLDFQKIFPDGKVFLLRTNRRCPENVVSLGSYVISKNKNRYEKIIKSKKPNGNIVLQGYSDRKGELISIMNQLEYMSEEERENTCICYRNKSSSNILVNQLLEREIHFNILSGVKPYSYGLFRAVMDILRALQIGVHKKMFYNLHKCLPINKKEMAMSLNLDPDTLIPTDKKDNILFEEINFNTKTYNNQFNNSLKYIRVISENIDKAPVNLYINDLIASIKDYYWDSVVRFQKLSIEEDIEFTESIRDFFNTSKTFPELYNEYERQLSIIQSDQKSKRGVSLSTFHSLKGLGFKNVIIMDLKESIFPNTVFIDSKDYPQEVKDNLKECETRLLYVAITRTIDNLTMYYDKIDPSIYISDILSSGILNKTTHSYSIEDEVALDHEIVSLKIDEEVVKTNENEIERKEDVSGVVVIQEEGAEPVKLEEVVKVGVENLPKTNNFRQSLRDRFFR